MKIVKYELSLVQKKELILTMEDDVDSEDLLKIFRVQPSGLLLLQVFRCDHYPDAIQFLSRLYVPLEIVPTLPEFCNKSNPDGCTRKISCKRSTTS